MNLDSAASPTSHNGDFDDDVLDDPTLVGSTELKDLNESGNHPRGSVAGIAPIGSIVGQYELLDEIARGAMGVVYRARHQTLGRMAAVKMILDADAVSSDVRERFETEARAAATLNHPGIVALFESGHWNGYPYFAMAYVDGESLLQRLRNGPMTPKQAAEMIACVSEAMAHAHARQIIHRDLKPANILIDSSGKPHITDFGVCKDLASSSNLTTAGEMVGTPHYMPPEQAGMANVPLGPAADVYSLGAVLFAMLTGRPPFLAATPIEVVSQVLTQDPVSPRALNSSVPIELSVITMKCLRKNPVQRYADAGELAADVNRFLSGQPILAKPPSMFDRLGLLLQRHVFFASVSSSVALAMLALTFFVFVSLMKSRRDLAETQEQLQLVQTQLNGERLVTSRFLRRQSDSENNRATIINNYELERLTDAIEQFSESNPELALQLTIETARFSIANKLEFPDKFRSRLVDAAQANAPNEDLMKLTLNELIEQAEKQVVRPMSSSERKVFGLPVDEVQPESSPLSQSTESPPTTNNTP
jgi:serine/threonine protein kinase